jgi:hypothetical protein
MEVAMINCGDPDSDSDNSGENEAPDSDDYSEESSP